MNGVWDTFEARLGRLMFAIAWVALGIESLVYGIPVMRLEAWGKTWPGYTTVGYITGVIVILAGIGLMWAARAKLSASINASSLPSPTAMRRKASLDPSLRIPAIVPLSTSKRYWSSQPCAAEACITLSETDSASGGCWLWTSRCAR